MTVPAVGDSTHTSTGTATARRWVFPLAFLALLFLLFAATATRGAGSNDVTAPATESWRLATAHTPWLDAIRHDLPRNAWWVREPNGHVVADRMAGPVLVSLPFYLLAGGSTAASSFSMVPAGISAALATALTVTLLLLALEPRVGRRTAAVACLAFALATPTWSVTADAPWTHTLTQLGIAGAAYSASRGKIWAAGVFLALGMTGRPHLALVAAVLGLGLGWTARSVRPLLTVGLPCVATVMALMCWGRWMFGVWTFSPPGYAGHAAAVLGGPAVATGLTGARAHLVNYLGFLVSPDRGLLVWTPVLLVLVPAVVRAWRCLPAWSVWLGLGGLTYTLAQLQMEEFTGGSWFYGYRYGLELITCWMPAMVLSWREVGHLGRRAVVLLVSLQVGVIGFGACVNGLIDVEPDPWTYNAFALAARKAPGLVLVLLILCALCGGLVLRLLRGRDDRSTQPSAG